MKIRKVLDKKINGVSYYKYVVSIPKEIAEDSKLLDKRLIAKLIKGQLVIGTGF